MSSEPIPFADFVGALREQLKKAYQERDPELPIEVGPVTVEFTLLTRQEGEGKVGIKFWVVDAGVSGKVGKESTQKVTLQLTPLGAGGGPLRVHDTEKKEKKEKKGSAPSNPDARSGRDVDVEPR
ncbi:trypco2 family protein [Rhodococcus koreensis]